MRVRSRSTPSSPGRHKVTGSASVNVDETFSRPAAEYRYTEDEVIKDYRRRQRAGELFFNPFFSQKKTFEDMSVYQNGTTLWDGRSDSHQWLGVMSMPELVPWVRVPAVPEIDVAALEQGSAIMALGNVNKTAFDMNTFVGEWSKTKRLHLDVCSAVVKVLKGAKVRNLVDKYRTVKKPLWGSDGKPLLNSRGQVIYSYSRERISRKTESPVTDVANAYLVGRYGVAPLLHDLEDAVKYVNKKFVSRATARGFGLSQQVATLTTEQWDTAFKMTAKVTLARTYSVRHGILYTVDPAMSHLASLGLTRPLSTAWELTPWAFAFDWLFRVGAWLDAVQPDGASYLGTWAGSMDTTVRSYEFTGSGSIHANGNTTAGSISGYALHTDCVKTRSKWSAAPPKLPTLGSGFNFIRSVDAVALMVQQIGAHFGRNSK